MIKNIANKAYNIIKKSQVPHCLKNNQINLNASQLKFLEMSIKDNYHQGWRCENNYTSEAYAIDLRDHLINRLEMDRITLIPWFNKTIQIRGSNILEIGCGTGSSTIAFAEQGANVTGVDFDEGALKVAKDRCKIYNLPVTIISGNAMDVYKELRREKFDLIVFFACMEHMVYMERIDCLRKYYDLLANGSYLSIVETPNRLWYFDGHTSYLPFYHWLPDDVAFDYSRYSDRINFKEMYQEHSNEKYLHFLRRGRGFSFHELEIALNYKAEKLHVEDYLRRPFLPYSMDYKYHKILLDIYPKISKGFFYPEINILIKKQQIE